MNSTPKPRHRLLAKMRQWHNWIGLCAALFLLVVGTTGVVLNYKKPIFTALGVPEEKDRPMKGGTHAADVQPLALPVTFAQALATAERELDGGIFERAELKREGDAWLYKVKHKGGGELWINAFTGAHFAKGEYEKLVVSGEGRPQRRGTDWGKILIDIHTGKIGGEAGKAFMTAVAVGLLFLSLSGVYLYLKPLLIRRAIAAGQACQSIAQPTPVRTRAVARELVRD